MKKESAERLKEKIESSGIHKRYNLEIEVDEFDTNEYSVDLVSKKPFSDEDMRVIESELDKMAKEIDKNILDVDCEETFFMNGDYEQCFSLI